MAKKRIVHLFITTKGKISEQPEDGEYPVYPVAVKRAPVVTVFRNLSKLGSIDRNG